MKVSLDLFTRYVRTPGEHHLKSCGYTCKWVNSKIFLTALTIRVSWKEKNSVSRKSSLSFYNRPFFRRKLVYRKANRLSQNLFLFEVMAESWISAVIPFNLFVSLNLDCSGSLIIFCSLFIELCVWNALGI